MRAVITGTDYIKDIDGSFKAIETNTNVGLSVDVSRYIDFDSFTQFVGDNGFEEIVLIYNQTNLQYFQDILELEPAVIKTKIFVSPDGSEQKEIENEINFNSFLQILQSHYSGSSVTITPQNLNETSVTIPDIEDSETKLIIRLAFDTTALIDDTYARDNWEFLKLMNDTDPNSIAKTYINDSELGFDSIGTVLRDNGNHPNYCVKKRITPTNNNIYPKLYKITTIQELNDLKSNLEVDEYIQEYIYNSDDLLNNKVKVYRSVDMVYGGELDVMNLWVVEHTAIMDTIQTPDYDDYNQVQIWDRVRYTTKYNSKTSDIGIKLSADDDTKILDPDNNIINVQNLNVGDFVKSINVPGVINNTDTKTTLEWTGSTETIMNEFSISSSEVVSKIQTEYFGEIIEFELENGSIFSDVPHAKILVETNISGSTVSVFKQYSELKNEDTLLIWDNDTNTIIKNEIVEIRYSYQKINAYTLNINEFDVFLTLEESANNRYGLLTHNYDYDCRNHDCGGLFLQAHTRCGGAGSGACVYQNGCIRRYAGNQNYAATCFQFYYQWGVGYVCAPQTSSTVGSFCNNQKPSDSKLKENTKFLYKTKDGLQIYKFTFNDAIKELWKEETGDDLNGVWKGVMAQELIGTQWESALSRHKNGFYVVDYDKLPKLD